MTAEFMSAWVDAPYAATPGASFDRAMQHITTIHAWVDRHPDRLLFATTGADVRQLPITRAEMLRALREAKERQKVGAPARV